MEAFESVLPRRAVPQPQPHLFAGGDCGACVLGGIFDCSVADAYQRFRDDGAVRCFSRDDMREALRKSDARRVVASTPIYITEYTHHFLAWGAAAWTMANGWFDRIAMAIESGHYGIACVNLRKGGAFSGLDHWVAIVGARFRWVATDVDSGRRSGWSEVLVSCSSTTTPDEEWVQADDFLRERGGYDTLLVKP